MSLDKIFDLTAGVYFFFFFFFVSKMSFDKISDLTAGVYFYFHNILPAVHTTEIK